MGEAAVTISPSLRAWLDGDASRLDTAQARVALSAPACWPRDERLDAAARARGFSPAPSDRAALLVSVNTTAGRTMLWSVGEETGGTPFGPQALAAQQLARQLARSELPALGEERTQAPWTATFRSRVGGGYDHHIDGKSFGLGFALAAGATTTDCALPPDLVGLACISERGDLFPVSELLAKLTILHAFALRLRRILVAEPDAPRTRDFCLRLGWDAEVIHCPHVADAWSLALPDVRTRVAERFRSNPNTARTTTRRLFDLTVQGERPLASWKGVVVEATAAEGVLVGIDADRARIAAAIATRHENEHRGRLDWEDVTRHPWPRPVRLSLAAHVVQHEADSASATTLATVKRATELIAAPLERHAEDLKLLGAIGRALAAEHCWQDAGTTLRGAVHGWIEIGQPGPANYALCEWLRVVAVLEDCGALAEIERDLVPLVAESRRFSLISKAYLGLALGRARLETGDRVGAVAVLEDTGVWTAVLPDHVGASRDRWLARAYTEAGEDRKAQQRREGLRRLVAANPRIAEFELLAAADVGAQAAMERLETRRPEEFERWRRLGVRADVRWWRY